MIHRDTLISGLAFFKLKNMKGRPAVETQAEYNMMIGMWCEALEDIPEEVFVAACKSLSDELTFYPALAEVRKKCLSIRDGIAAGGLEIWPWLKDLMLPSAYLYANPEDREKALNSIPCPITRKTAELFDWKTLSKSDESNESYHRHEFEKLFNSVKNRFALGEESKRLGVAVPASIAGLIGTVSRKLTKE